MGLYIPHGPGGQCLNMISVLDGVSTKFFVPELASQLYKSPTKTKLLFKLFVGGRSLGCF